MGEVLEGQMMVRVTIRAHEVAVESLIHLGVGSLELGGVT